MLHRLLAAALLACLASTAGAQTPDSSVAAAIDRQMSGGPFNQPNHIELTPMRRGSPADSARARAIADSARSTLARYRDIDVARRDGFQIFAAEVEGQRVFHFNNYAWAMANEVHFDPSKPTSLLYEKTERGGWKLVGAMYTAPQEATLAELDARVPLSIARWHRHVNFCMPASGGRARWKETRNGKPVFGPMGVGTRGECEALGGRFVPVVFGWMVHASVFGGDSLADIYGDHEHGGGHEH